MADALVLDGVSKVYEVGGIELVALHDVDLTVAEEEVVTLLGPSGSGKTTLLSIAGGLLSATSGKVIVGGKNITRARARKLTAFRRKRIGFIFQAVNLVPFLTARENLLVVAELARRDRAAAAKRADRLLDELGLGHRLNNLPAQLSGGERQRVAIGRALMNQPALVLVDEPTSALDSDLGQQVMELIVSEVKARGAAAVIVTHDQRMARYGDRILTMADGRIAGMAPRPEFTLNRGAPAPAELAPAPHLRALPAAAPTAFPTAPAAWPDPSPSAPAAAASAADAGDGWGHVQAAGRGAAWVPSVGGVPGPGESGPHGTDGWAAGGAEPDVGDGWGQVPAAGRGAAWVPSVGGVPGTGESGPHGTDGWAAGGAEPDVGDGWGQVPAAGRGAAWGPSVGGVPGGGEGAFPAAGRAWDDEGDGHGAGDGRDAGGPGHGPRTGQVAAADQGHGGVPAGLWANGPAVSPGASAGAAAGPVSGQWPATGDGAGSGWPSADWQLAERERKEVPAGLWANGPAVTPGAGSGGGPPTGQVPAAGRRPDPYDGLPGPRPEDAPAARGRHLTGPQPIAQPISAQTPVVPDRVWRRPATPPSARGSGGRRPPQLRPAHPAHPAAPSLPPPAAWPAPQAPPAEPATRARPEVFAEPPPGPGRAPATPMPPPGDGTHGVDPVESDRVRWLQQLTPPPTKAQPRPLALPDRPIWPTRYWDDGSSPAAPTNGAEDEPDATDGAEEPAAYDFGEYDG